MSCTNCFNGCTETVSDQCVKYTGINVPALGIQHGDTLLTVENAIVNFLVPVLDGTGIKPIINEDFICNTVAQFLPSCTVCTGFTLNDVLTAIIRASCLLQEEIDDIVAELAILNSDYDVNCLSGVTNSSDTHIVLQAAIDKICEIDVELAAFIADVELNYITSDNIDTYIQTYLINLPNTNLVSNKMIPGVIYPYYGSIASFDSTGAGTGDWIKIYLCNGGNPGVPDLRGRTLVGFTAGTLLGPTPMSSIVDPFASSFNFSYSPTTPISGLNQISLLENQLPIHTHPNTVLTTMTQTPHSHGLSGGVVKFGGPYGLNYASDFAFDGKYTTDDNIANITVSTSITNAPIGQNLPHSNVQPSHGCNFIIYLP
jgi:hypothetical protein